VVALEHVDPALGQRGDDLVAPVGVPVVVAEHGEHGDALERADRAGDHGRLLGLAVRGEIPGEQHEVDAVAQLGEGGRPALLVARTPEMDVARGGDANRALVLAMSGRLAGLRTDGHAPPRTRVSPALCRPTSNRSPTSRPR
jgi:hypothetical protein